MKNINDSAPALACEALVRPIRRIARIRSGLYNYRGYNLYRCKGEWVILDADNAAIEYAPRRADLVRIIDRMEQQPNEQGDPLRAGSGRRHTKDTL